MMIDKTPVMMTIELFDHCEAFLESPVEKRKPPLTAAPQRGPEPGCLAVLENFFVKIALESQTGSSVASDGTAKTF